MYFLHIICIIGMKLYYSVNSHTKKLMIISTKARYRSDYEKIKYTLPMEYEIIGICVLDEDMEGMYYKDTPIVSNEKDLYDFLRLSEVDEVFVSAPGYPVEMLELERMDVDFECISLDLCI